MTMFDGKRLPGPGRKKLLASACLVASVGCFVLFAGPREMALPERELRTDTIARRALAAPPPSTDVIANEYIVAIKPWAYAYEPDVTTGYCRGKVKVTGTFYALDGANRCVRVEIMEGESKVYQTNTGGFTSSTCHTEMNYDTSTTNAFFLGSYTERNRWGAFLYAGGDGGGACPHPRETRVRVRWDSSLTEYTGVMTEPTTCSYEVEIFVPNCTPTDGYRDHIYNGQAQAEALLGRFGINSGSVLQTYKHSVNGFAATLDSGDISRLLKDPIVERIESNYKVTSRSIPQFNLKDKPAANWGLERISSKGYKNGAYIYFHDGEGVDIYFLDTGINQNHYEFSARAWGSGSVCAGGPSDSVTHGTHVASMAGGISHGTARKSVLHEVQVLDANGEGTVLTVLCGVEWLIEEQAAWNAANTGTKKSVANIAFGTNGKSETLDDAAARMVNNGISVVIAAGNDGADACNYSPLTSGAITVGSIDDTPRNVNYRSATSNYGSCIDIFAPGNNIKGASAAGTDAHAILAGTSVASGLTAGTVALFVSSTADKKNYNGAQRPNMVKDKVLRKGERGAVRNEGAGSPNVIVQTTASVCQKAEHCPAGLTCMRDGSCVLYTGPVNPNLVRE